MGENRVETGKEIILSVIIPYCKETPEELLIPLGSIQRQAEIDFSAIECILVQDGGEGRLSGGFLSRLAPLFARCIYLSENKGPGVARQAGIDSARGEYVMFCDADDMLQNEWVLKIFLSEIEEKHPDIIHSLILCEYCHQGDRSYTVREYMTMMHGKVYKKAYLQENKIRFHEKLRIYEDGYFNSLAFAGTDNTSRIEWVSYVKTHRQGSISHGGYNAFLLETLPENIECAGLLSDAYQERYKDKLPYFLIAQAISIYQILHSVWEAPNESELKRKGEEAFIRILWPRWLPFGEALRGCAVSAFNKRHALDKTEYASPETFAGWLERMGNS